MTIFFFFLQSEIISGMIDILWYFFLILQKSFEIVFNLFLRLI